MILRFDQFRTYYPLITFNDLLDITERYVIYSMDILYRSPKTQHPDIIERIEDVEAQLENWYNRVANPSHADLGQLLIHFRLSVIRYLPQYMDISNEKTIRWCHVDRDHDGRVDIPADVWNIDAQCSHGQE